MKHREITQSSGVEGSRDLGGSRRRAPITLALLLALGTGTACGAATEDLDASESRGSQAEAFATADNYEFKYLSPISQPANATGDPGFCAAAGTGHSKIHFSLDTTGYVNGQSDTAGGTSAWSKYGGS